MDFIIFYLMNYVCYATIQFPYYADTLILSASLDPVTPGAKHLVHLFCWADQFICVQKP